MSQRAKTILTALALALFLRIARGCDFVIVSAVRGEEGFEHLLRRHSSKPATAPSSIDQHVRTSKTIAN
jgi:hypothetical protein